MTLPLAVLPWWHSQYCDDLGNPISNGSLEFFQAGTSTPLQTYADADGNTALGTVVDLDAGGFPITGGDAPTTIFLANSPSYKVILKNASGDTVRTVDGICDPGALAFATFGTLQAVGSKSVSSGYVIVDTDRFVTVIDASNDPSTVTVPTVVGWTSMLIIQNAGLHVLNVAFTSGQTVNTAAGPYVLPEGTGNKRPALILFPNSPSGWWGLETVAS